MSDTNDIPGGKDVLVEFDDGIAWVYLNRPDKRNAMSVELAREMNAVFDALEIDDRAKVIVLSGKGEAFSAGMDLQGFFRATDKVTDVARHRAYRETRAWQWRTLIHYAKPTIAMVNGWCFGGAFTPLICCDLAITDKDATFGLSEINWGIIPGGVVSKAITTLMGDREAMYYVMTGEKFDGTRAKELGLVNEAVPADKLRERTRELAMVLRDKNPTVLRQARMAVKWAREMDWEMASEYLQAKVDQTTFVDPEKGREQGLKQFLDEKTFKPGHGHYERREVEQS
ncbi:p-hydroxycinnamoyl CoA hydratase/lyase [Novosphingobium aquimarinum]|uniref:p-hydroxycinnamoyl CoA hydratase/lyase n=1 Tax=Novosphingobium aquimarinum TaxID=2682494 RepID=UPI0012EC35EC|nr:p-hydroxycinnamoyl CoA hydratase/lyase [Novosphingobium aquimarinum]